MRRRVRLGRLPTRISDPRHALALGILLVGGRLSFSWRLILAPPEVLDYVVAHEMAHLTHPGTGPSSG